MKRPRRSKGGFRDDIGIYVRSSWEHNYALYLNWLKDNGKIKAWSYETETFPHIEFHEVKGYMDKTSRTKLKRMAKYYPEIKIRLVDAAVMRDLNVLFRKTLPHWE